MLGVRKVQDLQEKIKKYHATAKAVAKQEGKKDILPRAQAKLSKMQLELEQLEEQYEAYLNEVFEVIFMKGRNQSIPFKDKPTLA